MVDDLYLNELRHLVIAYIRETRGVNIYYNRIWVVMPEDQRAGVALKYTESLHVAIDFALKLPVIKSYTSGESTE